LATRVRHWLSEEVFTAWLSMVSMRDSRPMAGSGSTGATDSASLATLACKSTSPFWVNCRSSLRCILFMVVPLPPCIR